MVSNQKIYDLAGIPRIDSFLTKLNRDYFARPKLIDNEYLKKLTDVNEGLCLDMARTGYIVPEAFIHFDKKGCIQDSGNVPISNAPHYL